MRNGFLVSQTACLFRAPFADSFVPFSADSLGPFYADSYSGRSKDLVCDGLKGFTGGLMTDGYAGYDQLGEHCSCWAHALRRFKQKLKDLGNVKGEDKLREWLAELLEGIAAIWDDDSGLRARLYAGELTRSRFLEERRKLSGPRIDRFFAEIRARQAAFTPGSKTGEAIGYALAREKELYNYLDYVEAAPDSNAAERSCKAFATGRKNWLFFQSVDSCDASSLYYSIIETAKEYGIDPLDYMEYVLRFGLGRSAAECQSLMPWNYDPERLEEARRPLRSAKPDPQRKEPYVFRGATT